MHLQTGAFKFSKSPKTIALTGIWIHATCWVLEKSHVFHFIQTPYLDKMANFLVPWRLTVESTFPYDAILTGYLVWENSLSKACTSTKIFPKTYTVALVLWTCICRQENLDQQEAGGRPSELPLNESRNSAILRFGNLQYNNTHNMIS